MARKTRTQTSTKTRADGVHFEHGEYVVVLRGQAIAFYSQHEHEAAESFFYQMRLDLAHLASQTAN
jgi:hypothetical protein